MSESAEAGAPPATPTRAAVAAQVQLRLIKTSDAPSYHSCLDLVARERRYLAQVQALPLERVQAFVAEAVAKQAAQFVAVLPRVAGLADQETAARLPKADAATHSPDEQVLGWCDVFPHWASALQHSGTLGMGVHPAWRGQGLGEALLRATLAHAAAQGICRVALEARADNRRAIALYEKLGFQHEGLARAALCFDGVFYDAVRMARVTPPAGA